MCMTSGKSERQSDVKASWRRCLAHDEVLEIPEFPQVLGHVISNEESTNDVPILKQGMAQVNKHGRAREHGMNN